MRERIIDEKRKIYTNDKYDLTIIEIKKEDGLKNDSFFEIDNRIFNNNKKVFIKQSIYLLHYPKGKEMKWSNDLIKTIYEDNYTIEHFCDTSEGSSGAPLISSINYKVIEIHKGGGKGGMQYNLGTLLKEPILEFKRKINKKENLDKEKIKKKMK